MTMAMRGVVLALLVLRRVPGSHSPTVRIEGGLQNCPWAVPTRPLSLNSVSDQKFLIITVYHSISILFQAPGCKILMWSLVFQIVTPPTTRPLVANGGFFDSAQVAYA